MSRLVALTGATGFIGNAFLQALIEADWRVRALTRQQRQNSDRVEWITGDLDDMNALRKLVDGVAAVIHCAGTVRGSSESGFNHTNVQGTDNLINTILPLTPAPRFLLISSLAAKTPELSWYAASKYNAEQIAINNLPGTIFRPTAVYGPGDREIKPLLNAMRRGVLLSPALSGNRFSLIHINDLVSAMLKWISSVTPVNGIFELDDGTPGGYDWESLIHIAEGVWHRPVKRIKIPVLLLRIVAYINLWLARIFHYSPMLTPGKIRELTYPDWICDNTLVYESLGWQPRVKLKDAIEQASESKWNK